jgi:MraZ protein
VTNFIGEYSAKIDDKGRLVFPSPFKSLCEESISEGFVLQKSLYANCLEMRQMSAWMEESKQILSRLNLFNPDHDRFWREYTRNRAIVIPDAKFGRISIPKELLSSINASKDVVFCGRDFKIEIWSKESYEASRLSTEDFVNLAQSILG